MSPVLVLSLQLQSPWIPGIITETHKHIPMVNSHTPPTPELPHGNLLVPQARKDFWPPGRTRSDTVTNQATAGPGLSMSAPLSSCSSSPAAPDLQLKITSAPGMAGRLALHLPKAAAN